jgi:zinc transport system substrate-binding protein
MNKRQKIFVTTTTIIIITAIIATVLYTPQNVTTSDKLKVVATFYPLAFFAQEIGGTKIALQQLVPDNTEVHDWQPSLADILELNSADVIIYNGASLDQWFEDDIIPTIDTNNKTIIKTSEGVDLLETSQDSAENGHEHGDSYDPHTWVSPYTAKQQAQNIYEGLIQKDPANKDYYNEHWQNLKTRLENLDNQFTTGLADKKKTDIFVAHSAFGYLGHRYGFEQHGIIGISADEQPSAAAYANLVDLMIEYQIYVVYVNPVYSDESAQTLRNELKRLTDHDVQILRLYVMLGNIDGLDYFGQQEKNLENLKIGLEA